MVFERLGISEMACREDGAVQLEEGFHLADYLDKLKAGEAQGALAIVQPRRQAAAGGRRGGGLTRLPGHRPCLGTHRQHGLLGAGGRHRGGRAGAGRQG